MAWWRDVIRPRILKTPPVERTDDRRCEIHALTSGEDWLNLIWALKSFYRASQRHYSLAIHDDGTLTEEAGLAMRRHFPTARFISRREADARAAVFLHEFPRSQALRGSNQLSLKVFDFAAFLESDRMLLIDSDFLFFDTPRVLLERLEDPQYAKNSLNKDWSYGYSVDLARVRALVTDFVLEDRINSGLGLVHRRSLRLDWIEDFLTLPGILSHPHRIEQTLIALCSCRLGYEMLPAEYDVQLGPWDSGLPCRHFTGPIRHLMYRDGMRHLKANGFLREPGENRKGNQ